MTSVPFQIVDKLPSLIGEAFDFANVDGRQTVFHLILDIMMCHIEKDEIKLFKVLSCFNNYNVIIPTRNQTS